MFENPQNQPISCGITLSEFLAVSTDELWEPKYLSIDQAIIHKLCHLDHLAIYWNENSKCLTGLPLHEIKTSLLENIWNKDSKDLPNRYIIVPISAHAKVKLKKSNVSN